MEEKVIRTGEHPDFLVMASDGLWDNMSSADAVTCVEQWLNKNKPDDYQRFGTNTEKPPTMERGTPETPQNPSADNDTYWDETEKAMKWRGQSKALHRRR